MIIIKIIGFIVLSAIIGAGGQFICVLAGISGGNPIMKIICDTVAFYISGKVFFGKNSRKASDSDCDKKENPTDEHNEITNNESYFCKNCMKTIPNNSIYCPYCGTSQNENSSEEYLPNKNEKKDRKATKVIVAVLGIAFIAGGIWYSFYTDANYQEIQALYDKHEYRDLLESIDKSNIFNYGFHIKDIASIAIDATDAYYLEGIDALKAGYSSFDYGLSKQFSSYSKEYFEYLNTSIGGYKDSRKYYEMSVDYDAIAREEYVSAKAPMVLRFLKKYSDDEIAKQAIENNDSIWAFLLGKWESSDKTYSLEYTWKDKSGEFTYNMPGSMSLPNECFFEEYNSILGYYTRDDELAVYNSVVPTGGYIGLWEAIELRKIKLKETMTKLIRITIIDENTLSAYCYDNGKTIKMYRQ